MFLICYNSKWSNDIEHSSFLFRCLHRNTFNLMINSEKTAFDVWICFMFAAKATYFQQIPNDFYLFVCANQWLLTFIHQFRKFVKIITAFASEWLPKRLFSEKKRRANDAVCPFKTTWLSHRWNRILFLTES